MLLRSPLYLALWGILLVVLGFLVVRQRRNFYMINKGVGDETLLKRVIRVHANASEYIPIAALLLLADELMGLNVIWIHFFGIIFTAARIYHAVDLTRHEGVSRGRMIGTATTWVVIVLLAVIALIFALTD